MLTINKYIEATSFSELILKTTFCRQHAKRPTVPPLFLTVGKIILASEQATWHTMQTCLDYVKWAWCHLNRPGPSKDGLCISVCVCVCVRACVFVCLFLCVGLWSVCKALAAVTGQDWMTFNSLLTTKCCMVMAFYRLLNTLQNFWATVAGCLSIFSLKNQQHILKFQHHQHFVSTQIQDWRPKTPGLYTTWFYRSWFMLHVWPEKETSQIPECLNETTVDIWTLVEEEEEEEWGGGLKTLKEEGRRTRCTGPPVPLQSIWFLVGYASLKLRFLTGSSTTSTSSSDFCVLCKTTQFPREIEEFIL